MSKKIEKVLLVTHPTRDEAIAAASELTKLLTQQKIEVFATNSINGAKEFEDGKSVEALA